MKSINKYFTLIGILMSAIAANSMAKDSPVSPTHSIITVINNTGGPLSIGRQGIWGNNLAECTPSLLPDKERFRCAIDNSNLNATYHDQLYVFVPLVREHTIALGLIMPIYQGYALCGKGYNIYYEHVFIGKYKVQIKSINQCHEEFTISVNH